MTRLFFQYGTLLAAYQDVIAIRRIVVQHTAGPYPGLRQIVGVFTAEDAEQGRIPDVLPAHPKPMAPMWPDGRLARALRLKATDRYVLYSEQVAAA